VPPAPSSVLLLVLLGGLRGLGQIFFLPNAAVGLGLAAAVSLSDWRLGPVMIAASVAAVGVGVLAGSPAWQVEQGLAGFTAALVAVAALRGFGGLRIAAVAAAIVGGPFVESAALRLGAAVGLHALSASYIGLVWTFTLLRPVRDAAAARSGWSMPAAPGGLPARPRTFESG
jgi:Urea transporter